MAYVHHRRRQPARGGLGSLLSPDPLPALPAPGDPEEQIKLLRRITAAEERFTRNDERFRYIQIGAILAVPLAGRIYTWLLKRRVG